MSKEDLSRVHALVKATRGSLTPLREKPTPKQAAAQPKEQSQSVQKSARSARSNRASERSLRKMKASRSGGQLGFEPMKQLQRPITDALGAVERVRQLEIARDEKDAISRAFSEEKVRCFELMD